jgi:DNA invertase Pin-like site-specific DNA recombinase
MKIGYARVSTLEQDLDLQLRALEKAGCKKIFREKVSGANRERPSFSACSIRFESATRSSSGNSTA